MAKRARPIPKASKRPAAGLSLSKVFSPGLLPAVPAAAKRIASAAAKVRSVKRRRP
jgi:hypothetical protein